MQNLNLLEGILCDLIQHVSHIALSGKVRKNNKKLNKD